MIKYALLVVALGAIYFGMINRGAVSGHEIAHDTPALIAYIIACTCGIAAGHLFGRDIVRKRQS